MNMQTWEIVVLVASGIAGLVLAVIAERKILRCAIWATGGSSWRALALLAAILLVGVIVGGVAATWLPVWYEQAPAVTLILTAVHLMVTTALLMPFFLSNSSTPRGATAREELVEVGADTNVSTVLGWGGGLVSLILLPGMLLVPLMVLIDP